MKTLTLTAVVLFCAVLSTLAQVGHWRLDNNGSDASSNNIDGTLQNSPTFSTDKKEGTHALVLNGTNQYVDLGNPTQFPSGTSAKTISAWAKTNVTTGNGVIFSYGSPSTSQAFYLGMNGTSLVGGAFGNSLTESNFWTTDTWQHVCMTYDGTTVRLYAGGVEVNFATRSWGVVLQRAYIGRHVNNNNYWNGSIDDVRIYNSALSASEVAALAATGPQVPEAPTNLAAATTSETQINLTWTDNSNNETGFQIERSEISASTGFSLIHTTAANVVSYSNTGLTSGVTYYYRISAVNANGNSAVAEANATTTSLIPAAPTSLALTASSSTAINVSWNDNSTNETGFQIYRSGTLNGTYSLIHTTAANVTSYINGSLTPETEYYYQVRATNASGISAYTSKESATTLSEGGSGSGPVGMWKLNNNVDDESGNGYHGSLVGSPVFSTDKKEGSHALSFDGTGYVELGNPAGLPSGTAPRSISVWAKTNTEAGDHMIVAYGTPASMQGMFIGQSGTALFIGGWSSNEKINNFWETGVWHHICLTYDGTTAKVYADGDEISSTPKSWNLALLRAYIGRHLSNNAYWNGYIDDVRIYSSALSASEVAVLAGTTTPQVPTAPTNLTATTVSASQINLAWTDNSTTETGFQIERATTEGGTYNLIQTTAANVTTYQNTSLTAGTTYYYRIRAVNMNANSSYTDPVEVRTLGAVSDAVEVSVLKDLFLSLGGSSWNSNTNWPEGTWPNDITSDQFSTWYGVTVENGDIVALSLPSNNLSGTIPLSIGYLSSLNYLSLSENSISGTIPSEIGNLTKLRTLDLARNNLMGNVPNTIWQLNELTMLDVGSNQLTGEISSNIANLTELRTLGLSSNEFSGEILEFVTTMPHLVYLNVSENQFTGELPTALTDFIDLQYLSLSHNNFAGELPATIGNLINLSWFTINHNQFEGNIPSSVGNFTNLTTLRFNNNSFLGPIPASIGEIPNIQEIDLSFNQLTGDIPSSFASNLSLYWLILSSNQLSGEVPSGFPNLERLIIDHNNFTGIGDLDPDNYYINVIQASHNQISSIPPSISGGGFWIMDFSNNDIGSIPPGFVFQASELDLSNNFLDFAALEPITGDFDQYNYTPQKKISDITSVTAVVNGLLEIPSRSTGQYSTIVWEKLTGSSWVNVTSQNQDHTGATFQISQAQTSHAGTYRWKMTNSLVTGLTLESEPIEVIVEDPVLSALDQYAFQYRYDARKRMTQKKVPGADWVYMVYDHRDRLVLTQDGNQRAKTDENDIATPQWTYTKYDALNRPILTGIYTHSEVVDQDDMQTFVNGQYGVLDVDGQYPAENFYEDFNEVASTMGYTNRTFPNTNTDILTVTYYDRYDFRSMIGGTDDEYVPNELDAQEGIENQRVLGQVTGTQIKVLGAPTPTFLWSVNYYDDKYRVIQNIALNQLGGTDIVTNVYDFVGKVKETKTVHNVELAGEQMVWRGFDYDHAGRLMKIWHKLNEQDTVLLVMNEYNELGQLVTKKLHNTDPEQADDETRQFEQNVDYRYNIRGWLESVNDLSEPEAGDLFGMNLHYNNPTANGGTPQYNGNISEIQWKGPDAKTNSYGYNYDPMNRLTEANFYNATDGNRFNEQIKDLENNRSGYDLNGNILFLQRNGKTGIDGIGTTTYGEMDKLKYEYRGNQLLKVTDDAIDTEGFIDGSNTDNDYAYDKNGNMIIDKNKSIDDATTATGKSVISYNYLNLPEKVVKSSGEYLIYNYDATGRKLSQEVYNASNELQKKSDYAGEFFYEDNTLKFVNHEEGRVVMSGSQGEYQYHLKDHLGNVRLTFTTKEELESVTATLEDAKATTEQSQFLNYAEVRKIDNKLFDHTDEGGTYNSTRLMGGNTTEVYGLAKTLSVMPGDVIRMEVYAKYLDPETDNWSAALQNVISSIAGSGNAGGTYVDGGQLGTIDGAFPHPGLLVRENDEGEGPKAYLNYLLFDRDFNYLTGGFERVSTAARESGTTLNTNAEGISHEHLHFDDGIVINEAGYVYIYLSNENETPVEVFFDDFMVEQVKSPVVQMDDYYPFGLTFNSYSRENTTPQDYTFNGKEEQNELSLGWLDFGARMYQPELGRFFTQDRFSENYFDYSPYHYVGNNPLKYVDINGDSAYSAIKSNAEVIVNDLNTIYKNKYGEDAADAFTVTTGSINVTKTVEQDIEFDLFNPDTWDGKTEVTVTEEQEVYFITTNADSKFDWNTDKYSQATFDVLNTNRNIEVLVQRGDTQISGWPLYTTMQQEKGHAYKEQRAIGLWVGLNRASKGGWSFGGTFLHEAVNHFHHLGAQEPAHPLQRHFGLPRSATDHPGTPRMKWSEAEKRRLNNLRSR